MSPPTLRRAIPLALLLSTLALPAAAQPPREPAAPNIRQLISTLWEHLEASLLSPWETAGAQIPPPTENTTDDGDGRIHIDPDG